MPTRWRSRRGQAIVMVTLALFAMCGLMGLAVDLGWSFFVKKAAQRAADSAALAAVKAAFATVNQTGPWQCTANPCPNNAPCMVCQATPQSCAGIAVGSNLYNGCQYAQQNGFTSSGRQTVRMSSDITSPFQTRTGPIGVHYWATATVVETIPQLFSAIWGNGTATVAATATAAIVELEVPGTLILLNRRNDRTAMSNVPGGQTQFGVNLLVQANDNQGQFALQTAGGIRMASDCGSVTGWDSDTCSNGGNQHLYAGENQGGGTVYSPETKIRGEGWYQLGGSSEWIQAPTNHHSTGFGDPMAGKGQPPPYLGTPDWTGYPVPNGLINASFCEGLSGVSGQCPPGQYFATERAPCGQGCPENRASGIPLQVEGNIRFTSGQDGFGNFVFYGGLTKGTGNNVEVWFEPAVYVFAGAKASQNSPGVLLDTATNFTMRDATTGIGQNSDAGALFIFTNGTYTNADGAAQLQQPTNQEWSRGVNEIGLLQALDYGTVELQAGSNGTYINLHGLNPDHATIRNSALETFAPTLMWWDQGNSSVRHDINGNVVCTDPALEICTTNSLEDIKSPELRFQASPSVHLYGTVYQPRGAWTTMIGGGGYSGPLQLITGSLQVKANSNVNLIVPENTVTITIVSLIQ